MPRKNLPGRGKAGGFGRGITIRSVWEADGGGK